MIISEIIEGWSKKYKRSIDCSHPKGFSQRAHCQGRKKNEDLDDNDPRNQIWYGGDNDPDGPRTHQDYRVTNHIDIDKIKRAYTNPDGTKRSISGILNRIGRDAAEIPRGIKGIEATKNFYDKYRNYLKDALENESAGDRGDIPTGPGEQLIPFPAGTTMIDVSDAYDWYKLGMVISDLDDADPKIFGQGAPHTAIVFGSEEEEHKLLPLLKRLGLSIHDIDNPQDVKKAIPAKALIQRMEENSQGLSEGHNKAVISEAREAPLYHFTSWNNLIYIISGNELKSPRGKIYLTRDYDRQFIPHENQLFKQPYGIRLNQDLLSRDYGKKLQPGGQDAGWDEKQRQAWLSDPKNADEIERIKRTGQGSGLIHKHARTTDIVKGTITTAGRWESEEHLNVKSVPNLNKYITGIVIGEIDGQEHASLETDADPLTKFADVLIHIFSGKKAFEQRNWLLDSAAKLNVPIIYKRKEFDPIEVKNRIIQLYSQRKKEREEEDSKTKQKFMFITNKAGGGFMFGASDIPAALRALSKDFKFKDRIIYGYSIGYDPKAEKTMFDKPGTPEELLKNLDIQKENFADGRNPQDKGDSARHGIRKGMTIAQLKKIRSSKTASARKKQLAHWQINMRQGKKKP